MPRQLAEVSALHYLPDGSVTPAAAELTAMEQEAMNTCFDLGRLAMEEGPNPPIGAVLLSESSNASWAAKTVDWDKSRVLGHAEVLAYLESGAIDVLGDDLSKCTLVTTAEPCVTCTAPFAEGAIGRIVFAATRTDIRATTGIMRAREINMHELLRDGRTDTTVIQGFRREGVLALFSIWHATRKNKNPRP